VKTLLENGVQPDILVLRTEKNLNSEIRKKVALFCNVDADAVIQSIDVPTIYDVPIMMKDEKLDKITLRKLNLPQNTNVELHAWKEFLQKVKNPKSEINIALVGKYTQLPDAYKSICESFVHAGAANECKVHVKTVNSEKLNDSNVAELLSDVSGILVAPGFGQRGIDGKFTAVKYARENNIPFLGICLGMQCAVIEFARNVLGYEDANSTEMDESTQHPVIDIMESQKNITEKGGTMRLGAYSCTLEKDSLAYKIYGQTKISERHRHRYEFNNEYLEQFKAAGMIATGFNESSGLVEIMEIPAHRWFIGVQFHPEYKSTVLNPHPLFIGFVNAAKEYKSEAVKK
jgi:CTP synthase